MANTGVPAHLSDDHSVYIPVYTDLQNRDNIKQNKSIIKGSEPQVFQPWKFETPEHISKIFLVKKFNHLKHFLKLTICCKNSFQIETVFKK